jgi:hypothetical protein
MLHNLHLTAYAHLNLRHALDRFVSRPMIRSCSERSQSCHPQLERDLGTVLFERKGRNVCLTPEGETLMRHVERGFGELHLGLSSVAARKPQLLSLDCAKLRRSIACSPPKKIYSGVSRPGTSARDRHRLH